MRPLVVIPARGGSKGLPGKNIKLLNGKPLILYTVEAALKVFSETQVYISTDDCEIKSVVESIGLKVPELRPANLSTDLASSQDVLLHCLNKSIDHGYQPDTIILLQVTSPFRNEKHIQEALKIYDSNCDMVVSVKKSDSNPYYTLMEEDDFGWLKKSKPADFERRQDCPVVYDLNGAIYVIRVSSLQNESMTKFKKVKKYLMKMEHSIDIDNQFDWDIAEMIIHKGYI
jgi:CMP-N,N'-diacetyllegionaminic acid synthase